MLSLVSAFKDKASSSRIFLASTVTVILCSVGLLLAALAFPVNGISGDGLPRFFGRFHPLILHFPIVLLPLALVVELLKFAPEPWRRWSSGSLPILVIAALAASITAILGILLAANEGHAGELVERHRMLGIAVALLSMVALGLRLAAELMSTIRAFGLAFLGTLVSACLIMIVAAHDGGKMVHGNTYLAQYAPGPFKKMLGDTHSPASTITKDQIALSPKDEALHTEYVSDIAPIVERYCGSCHGASRQSGGIRFDELSPIMSDDHDVEVWSSVRDALNAHQMPPPDEARQPTNQDRQHIIEWITSSFDYVAEQRRANRASPLRRLTIEEYENSLQELFGTAYKFGQTLPSAPISEHGYSRDTSLLTVSALELEYFLNIARESVEHYVVFGGRIPESEHFLIEFEDTEYRPGVDGGYSLDKPLTAEALSEKRAAREAAPTVYSERTLFPLPDGPALANTLLQRSALQKFNGLYAKFQSQKPYKAGELVARVRVAAKLGDDGSAPRLQLRIGSPSNNGFSGPIAGECDVTAPVEAPQVCTFRVPLRHLPGKFKAKTSLNVLVFNVSHDPDAIFDVVPEGLNFSPERPGLMARYRKHHAESILSIAAMRKAQVNELYLDAVEIDILPFGGDAETSPNIFRVDALRASQNAGINARSVAEDTIKAFMERAYRRSVAKSELEEMLELYDQFQSEGDNFKEALLETLSTVLISTPFLYVAAPAAREEHAVLSEEEHNQIASRLSYFLWSGPPDEPLLDLASQDQLSDPRNLATQVERMLADKRSRRFSESFAREWLRLDKFDLIAVNPEFYPFYDKDLGKDMVAESIATFQAIFHNDRDARELLSSDTVYVNQRLARHYGLPPITGGELRPVPVPDYSPRGGLLHQGAILTMTADGAESNPIYRGVWILERILNDPPPPPPPAVPPLDISSDDFASLSLKQKIELHAKQSACAACHAKIDPWGIALENFDAIGSWRNKSLVINPDTSEESFIPVDSSTVLTTGDEIHGSTELASYLYTERGEEFTRSLAWHMMTYALGRVPNLGDEQELDTIYHQFRSSGFKFSTLVLAIVQSEAFQSLPERPIITNDTQMSAGTGMNELASQTTPNETNARRIEKGI